jgi:UTP--glucose-1-phosphate uridylyltransferase
MASDIVALILAAGWGTRLLPATKAVPKEVFPLVDRPLIQHTLEEVVASGVHHAVIVTARGKDAIQSYFDRVPELEELLASRGDSNLLETLHAIVEQCDLSFVRQREQLGIGHAVKIAHHAVGDRVFVLCFPDDVISSKTPVIKQLLDVHKRYGGAPVLAVERVPKEAISRYGVVDVEPVEPGVYRVKGLVEKPKPEDAPSDLGIVGRYVLTPDIFDVIEHTKPGANNELQITDALQNLLALRPIYACEFEGTRYDTGNHLGFLRTQVALALKRPDMGRQVRAFLKELLAEEPE